MRVLVFGGSFNPPHVAHVLVVAWALWTERADRILVIPTADHPFGKDLAPFGRRLAWTRAAMGHLGERVEVSDLESRMPGPSYTIATMEALAAANPTWALRLLIGADLLEQMEGWRRGSELRERFRPLVVGRPGHPAVEGVPSFPDVSSSQVRARIAAGAPIDGLVPASVLRALTEEDLALWRSSAQAPGPGR